MVWIYIKPYKSWRFAAVRETSVTPKMKTEHGQCYTGALATLICCAGLWITQWSAKTGKETEGKRREMQCTQGTSLEKVKNMFGIMP